LANALEELQYPANVEGASIPARLIPAIGSTWHLLTSHYPPDRGGVADYTANVGEGLSRHGVAVQVWCPQVDARARTSEADNPIVARIPSLRKLFGWRELGKRLGRPVSGRVLFVQYVPHGWGCHAMNVGFCLWLAVRARVRGDEVRVMFHEVAMPFVRRPFRHNIQAVVHRLMAMLLLSACRKVYVSTPAFAPLLSRLSFGRREPIWLPVPSNIPRVDAPDAVRAVRMEIVGGDSQCPVIGHFGTYASHIAALLRDAMKILLSRNDKLRLLCIGRGSIAFCAALKDELAESERSRVHARENLDAESMSAHIQACDVMLQPYADGVTTRRTTAMAALANAVPLVTNLGPLSEDLWAKYQIASTAAAPNAALLADQAEALLQNRSLRDQYRAAGSKYYEANFAVDRTIQKLLDLPVTGGNAKT
ncbi:MAG TPA: glycosyltransferase, partial [Tepidisphaeraceae bacterium]